MLEGWFLAVVYSAHEERVRDVMVGERSREGWPLFVVVAEISSCVSGIAPCNDLNIQQSVLKKLHATCCPCLSPRLVGI